MNRFYKTFLLWLLVAVLPLHAVAATMSMSCGPVHQQAMQVVLLDDAHHHHDGSATSDSHHHDAATMPQVATDATAPDDSTATDDAAAASVQHASCSACSATCIGAAAPPSAPLDAMPACNGSQMVTVAPASLAIGYTPSGLERPPKHRFA